MGHSFEVKLSFAHGGVEVQNRIFLMQNLRVFIILFVRCAKLLSVKGACTKRPAIRPFFEPNCVWRLGHPDRFVSCSYPIHRRAKMSPEIKRKMSKKYRFELLEIIIWMFLLLDKLRNFLKHGNLLTHAIYQKLLQKKLLKEYIIFTLWNVVCLSFVQMRLTNLKDSPFEHSSFEVVITAASLSVLPLPKN